MKFNTPQEHFADLQRRGRRAAELALEGRNLIREILDAKLGWMLWPIIPVVWICTLWCLFVARHCAKYLDRYRKLGFG